MYGKDTRIESQRYKLCMWLINIKKNNIKDYSWVYFFQYVFSKKKEEFFHKSGWIGSHN